MPVPLTTASTGQTAYCGPRCKPFRDCSACGRLGRTAVAAVVGGCGRAALRAVCLAGLLAVAGCAGYQVGTDSLYPAHIRTVYVPVFESDSLRRNLGERLTEAVAKQIEARTPFKVVNTPTADTTLLGRITADTKRVVIENPQDFPRETEVGLQVQVRWIDHRGQVLGQWEPIPVPAEAVMVAGSSRLLPEMGQSVATAQQRAIDQIAQQIVGMMETPW